MIGKKIIRFESLESTNNYIKNNSDSLDEGTVVVSETQTSGRGRSNRVWMSEEGNLYFSFLLRGDIFRSNIFKLITQVSNAIIKLLKDFNIKAQIKYPNDILVEDKKICGILIESYGALEIDYVVAGIGINVNQLDFKEINDKAISMKNIINIDTDVDHVLRKFIDYYNELEGIPFNILFDDYIKYSMIIGKKMDIDGRIYNINGITEEGNLIIENNNKEEYINLNEINIKDLY